MIQLVFDASNAAAGAETDARRGRLQPARGRRAGGVGRRQARARRRHASRSCTRPPAPTRTSSARRSTSAARRTQGVGCDDTRGPTFDVRPVVRTIPSDPAQARQAFPWIAFQGRWGELRPAFFNGPTGPNLKTQWTEPIRVVGGLAHPQLHGSGRRARSGPGATGFFCGAVGGGSRALVALVDHPLEFGLVLAGLVAARDRPAFPGDLAPVRSAPASRAAAPGARSCPPPRGCTRPGSRSSSGSGSCSCRSRCVVIAAAGARAPRDRLPRRPDRAARATGWSRWSCSRSAPR